MIMAEQSLSNIEGKWLLPEGTRLDNGNITIRAVLGEGGFGITYRADDRFFGEIALKEFLPKSMINSRNNSEDNHDVCVKPEKAAAFKNAMRQFWREPRIINTLKHPNIVQVLFDFQENNTAYYGMRLLKGMDLVKWIQKEGKPLDYEAASKLLFPIMDALIYMHQKGTYHRDISPSNIFLEQKGDDWSPCLIDFGAAYTAQKDFTHTFNRVYNKNFSPPEQNWDSNYQGPHSDVYSFCATFYYAMTGIVPLSPIERGTDEKDKLIPLIDAIPEGMPPISQSLNSAVMNGLKLDPEERTQKMQELKDAINGAGVVIPHTVERLEKKDQSPKKASAKPILALLLDWALLYLVVVAANATGLSWTVCIAVGAVAFLIVNGLLLAENGATIGQRIVGCTVRLKSKGMGFLYALVRLLPPFALIDECVACGENNRRPLTKGLFATEEEKSGEDAHADAQEDVPDADTVTRSREAVSTRLVCLAGEYIGRVIELDAPQMFGRDKPSTLIFQDNYISTNHCLLRRMSEKTWHVIDLNSKNGTYLNGRRLEAGLASSALKPGDRLSLCKEVFIYEEG